MAKYNFSKELIDHFMKSGYDKYTSTIAAVGLLSTLTPDFKVEALTYRKGDKEVRKIEYPLNLYTVFSGKAGSGKTTLLNKMIDIYTKISPIIDNVVSAKSSSMGIFKNIPENWNYTLINGDDADWLLNPELKDGAINESLLKMWNRRYLEKILQSKDFSNTKNTTLTIWIGIHGFEGIDKGQIKNGLVRRFLVNVFLDGEEKNIRYSDSDDIGKRKKNISEQLNIKVINQIKLFIKDFIKPDIKKDYNVENVENYRVYLVDNHTERYLRKVFDRVEDYIKTKSPILDQVIRTYPEILQRFVAVYSLWDSNMIVINEKGEYENLGRVISVSLLKEIDELLWNNMLNYYDELEKVKLGTIKFVSPDYEEQVNDMRDLIKREGKIYIPTWKVKRNYSIDINLIKKIIEIGINTGSFVLFFGKRLKNKKKGYYLATEYNEEELKKDFIEVKVLDYNFVEELVL